VDFRFNGAAFFQSGKCVSPSGIPFAVRIGFNGAAFFQSGKCYGGIAARDYGDASMEPLFFKAENDVALSLRRIDDALQWSRFFFKAENTVNSF